VLIIYTARLPDPSLVLASQNDPSVLVPTDLRRITYWLADGGGLCRQETALVTSDDLYQNNTTWGMNEPPTVATSSSNMSGGFSEKDCIIAKEVTDLQFEYYDINSTSDDGGWNTLWNGTNPGPDGITPAGPPTAIRVTFSIKLKGPNGEDTTKQYKQVIPILTANGPDANVGNAAANASGGTQ